jgi:hypothetical protein
VTPEGRWKVKVKALLKRYGVYQHWPVLNGMGSPTLDCVSCVCGYYLVVETKAAGEKPTPRQQITMAEMRTAGAFVFVVSSESELAVLEAYLQLLTS